MKNFTILLLCFLLPATMLGQWITPDCRHLTVDLVVMDDDTANLMKITLANNCDSCSSGISGCVYLQLEVIRTIAPFDTIASSGCWCLWSPENDSQKTYAITSSVTTVPSPRDIRVSLMAGGCGCDSIPFTPIPGVSSNATANSIEVYPNPVNDFFEIKNDTSENLSVRLSDLSGKIILVKRITKNREQVSVAGLEKGIYVVEVMEGNNKRVVRTFRVVKE